MEIEGKRGLRSTFFFLNETYPVSVWKPSSWRLGLGYYSIIDPKVKLVIRTLDAQGWEIGLHSSYLSYKDSHLVRSEKKDLEMIVGHAIHGVRQHYLNLDENTWLRQAEAGFLYDASYGYTRDIGFKEGKYSPFSPISGRRFYVVPLALMDCCVMSRVKPLREAMNIVNLAEEKKACLVLNWHQRMFNEKEFPGYLEIYLDLIDACKRKKARFCTIGEYVSTLGVEGFS
jgi:peptidoglycan/xylan/chitin deacetylase (PgdA/CDA1 family)